MGMANESTVTVNLKGLMLFCLDKNNKICEAKIHTADGGHRMEIKAQAAGNVIYESKIGPDELKTLESLSLFVDDEKGSSSVANSVTKGEDFDSLIYIDGNHFYHRPLEMKDGKFGCSIFLHQGVIGAGNYMELLRVKPHLFPSLKFEWESQQEWETFKNDAIKDDPDSIVKLPGEVAVDTTTIVPLQKGQSFRLRSGKTNTDLFHSLPHGANYQIDIKYADAYKPISMAECIGFGHFCEAMVLKEDEPVYGIFRPTFKGMSANLNIEVGCLGSNFGWWF